MCRVGFVVFSDKLEACEKASFVAKLAAEQDAQGGHSQGFTALKFSEDNSHWDYVNTYRILGAAEKTKDVIYRDVLSMAPFDAILMHNRYATHGGVNLENCHPIEKNGFFVVHNGIFTGYTHFLKEGEKVGSVGNWTSPYYHEDDFNNYGMGTWGKSTPGMSDTAIAARLISEEGLEVFKRVLIGSGTFLWYDGKDKVIRGIRTGFAPLDLFAMVKGGEPMIWGMVSDVDDLPQDTTWEVTTKKPLLGEILSIDQKEVKNGTAAFQLIARHAMMGQVYEFLPQGMFRKVRLFDDETTGTTGSNFKNDVNKMETANQASYEKWEKEQASSKKDEETSPLESEEGWSDPDAETVDIDGFWAEKTWEKP